MLVPPKTPAQWKAVLKEVAPQGRAAIIDALAAELPALCKKYELLTVNRQAHFLGQLIHESDHLKTTEEYASGAAYEGRRDLGNTQKGDGRRFKGRGLIQLTGRANYAAAGKALKHDFVRNPTQVAKFPHAATVSAWFWDQKALNRHADRDDIQQVTRTINGGLRHLDRRAAHTKRTKKALGNGKSTGGLHSESV